MDSFSKAKLKSENQDLRSQIDELNKKLDILNISLKFKQLIEFIKLKNNIIRISKIDKEEKYDIFISQFIQNEKNNDILKRIFPFGCMETDYYKYYLDLKEIYNRIIHNS